MDRLGAFEAYSKMPDNPHAKNKGRGQAEIVDQCFSMELPRRALRYTMKIKNWRRGTGYGEFAYYCAVRGDQKRALQYLGMADQLAEAHRDDPNAQEWRYHRIRAKIAKTYFELGELEKAAEFAAGIGDVENAEVGIAKIARMSKEDAKRQLEIIDGHVQDAVAKGASAGHPRLDGGKAIAYGGDAGQVATTREHGQAAGKVAKGSVATATPGDGADAQTVWRASASGSSFAQGGADSAGTSPPPVARSSVAGAHGLGGQGSQAQASSPPSPPSPPSGL